MRFGLVAHWANVRKFGVAIFDIYLSSRIMRLTMLEIGKHETNYRINAELIIMAIILTVTSMIRNYFRKEFAKPSLITFQ